MATAFTGHSCGVKRQTRCDGVECGDNGKGDRYKGTCDADGCDVNTYRNGNETFYGEGAAFDVDTKRPFTVVTQFLTEDGTDTGKLSEVRRHYVQDGVRIETPASRVGEKAYDSISDGYCAAEKATFNSSATFLERGGLSSLDDAFSNGMVLVLSIWDDCEAAGPRPLSLRPSPATAHPHTLALHTHPIALTRRPHPHHHMIGLTSSGSRAPARMTWLHMTWLHMTWLHMAWRHVTWRHLTWRHLTWRHMTWLHMTWLHMT
eukprot:7043691-Prymnesium_polylepis.1